MLGIGGMGEVYQAVDTQLKRHVAIKVLPDTLTRDPDRRARFQREAELLASLNHPQIAQIYGVVDTGDQRALVMELVEGPTLADRIARKALPLSDALAIAMQIAEALEAAHERGIIHRDLKPANIKLRPDGAVKVLDFGLAKAVGPAATPSGIAHAQTETSPMSTHVGAVMGTAAYMSPEQSTGAAVDERTDIWALGCVLFEMLSGRAAFAEATIPDTLVRIRDGDPDWRVLPSDVPDGVRRLLRRCLEKAPKRRLHAAADVRIAIEDALQSSAAVATPARASRAPWVIASLVIVAAVLLAWPRSNRSAPDLPRSRLDINTPLTHDAVSFALSPNGRHMVFVALDEGTPYLWLRRLDDTTAQRLADTDGASYPFWSPNSQSVGFFAHGLLKRINLEGGSAEIVAHARNGLGGAWSGNVILYSANSGSVLFSVPATGGKPIAVTRMANAEVTHRFPAFLPDGRRFVFRVGSSTAQSEGLSLASLDTPGAHQRIAASDTGAEYVAPGFLVTVRSQALVAIPFDANRGAVTGDPISLASGVAEDQGRGGFSVSQSGIVAYRSGMEATRQLAPIWIHRNGQPGNTLAIRGRIAALTRDGAYAAVVQQTPGLTQTNTDIWIVHTTHGLPRRFTFDAAFDVNPVWSRDGVRIAFASNRQGVFDLFEKPARFTADERLLLGSRDNKFPNDWSPDGRVLLFVNESADTGDDVWTMPIDDPSKAAPLLNGPYGEHQSQFSPDGRWLAYRSNESGRFEIYLRPYPGPGSQQLISRGGGIQPRWRADGRELYYISGDSRLTAVPIRLPTRTDPLEVGTPTALFPVRLASPGNAQFGYSVDVRGERFLVSVAANQPTTKPITLLQNWHAPTVR